MVVVFCSEAAVVNTRVCAMSYDDYLKQFSFSGSLIGNFLVAFVTFYAYILHGYSPYWYVAIVFCLQEKRNVQNEREEKRREEKMKRHIEIIETQESHARTFHAHVSDMNDNFNQRTGQLFRLEFNMHWLFSHTFDFTMCVLYFFFNRHYCRHQTAVSLMPRIHHTHAYREWETHSHFDFDTKKENEKSINAFNRVRFLVHSKPIWNVNQVCFVIHSWNKNAKSVFACPSPPFGNHLYACMCVDVCVL